MATTSYVLTKYSFSEFNQWWANDTQRIIWSWRFLLLNKVSLRLLFFPFVNLWLGCRILYPTLNANVSCLQDLHFCFFGCLPCISGFTRAMIITNNDDDELMIDIMSSKNCLHFSFTGFLCPTRCWTYMERLGVNELMMNTKRSDDTF